ncbi:MAG TPA: hypothetical protein VK507_03750, partial [Iamia sp.]|nr:hypothetical protein [Iamia sp.]
MKVVDASSGVLDLDLDAPLPRVTGSSGDVRCLLRRGSVPVGVVDLFVPVRGLDPDALAAVVEPDRWTATDRAPVD